MADKPAHEDVTKAVMEEYETLRKKAIVNMRDRMAVYTAANHEGLHELAAMVGEDLATRRDRDSVYVFEIIKRYDFYIKKYELGG